MPVTTEPPNRHVRLDAGLKLPHRATAVLSLAVALLLPLMVAPASEARPYTVVSCDAAPGFSAEAWRAAGSAGSAYSTCPTLGGENAGISNRITGVTVPALADSSHTFTAPTGSTISSIRWGGRLARGDCRWGVMMLAQPGNGYVFGLRPNATCLSTALDIRSTTIPFTMPAGTRAVQQIAVCGAGSCGPGAAFHTQSVAVTVEDPTRPVIAVSGALVSGRWVRGDQEIRIAASDNSGISSVVAALGTQAVPNSFPCDFTRPAPCLSRALAPRLSTLTVASGSARVAVRATDAAGNITDGSYPVWVDNEPPTRVRPLLAGGEGWRRRNSFSLAWENPAQPFAPITRVHYRLCGPEGCVDGAVEGADVHALPSIAAAAQGDHTLQVWLEDQAGNTSYALSASEAVHLRLDQEAPEVAFDPQDADDPLRVSIRASDGLSGLDTGSIEMRRKGGDSWQGIAAARQGDRLVGYVDDERFGSGAFEFRAHARDLAGNESTTDRRANGARATIDLPVRFATRLAVGVRTVSGRRGHRKVTLVPRARVRWGAKLKLTGSLENADGQPVAGATLEVSSDSPGDAVGLAPVGVARTDRDGGFTYIVRGTRNKVVRFRYPGTRRIRAATQDFTVHVRASSTIRARPRGLRNGQTVTLSGRVLTLPLPLSGKLIEVQAFFRNRWRTFSTTRAQPMGGWTFDYQFGGTRGRVPYRLRVRLPAEGGYPFDTGSSRTARVIVTGL